MSVDPEAHPSCAVCRRRLLPGERAAPYVTPEGHEVAVCELCKARAEAAGWLRPEQAAAATAQPSARGRQRGQLFGGLRRRAERERGGRGREEREPASGGDDDASAGDDGERQGPSAARPRGSRDAEEAPRPPAERARAARPARPERSRAARPERAERPPRNAAGPDLDEAIAAFNASELRRTVASLSRTLGEPRATALAVRTAAGGNGARITVAWELAWYQWEIGAGRRRPEIRQIAKGETVDQLRAADRNWNLRVEGDGTLARRSAAGYDPGDDG